LRPIGTERAAVLDSSPNRESAVTTITTEAESFLKLIVPQLVKQFPTFYGPEGSLSASKEVDNGSYPLPYSNILFTENTF
jgi:hypothetical protein